MLIFDFKDFILLSTAVKTLEKARYDRRDIGQFLSKEQE